MNIDLENPTPLAAKILEAETKLEQLAAEIEEIGSPASNELLRRLEVLRIEESALKRNFGESLARNEPDSVRMHKIEALLRHIEDEQNSMKHDADFLNQAAPSSVGVAMHAGASAVEMARRGVKAVIGDSHPLGCSAFVNHTHKDLEDEYGLEETGSPSTDKP